MKEFNLGYISNNKKDFKKCKECGLWNYNERDKCRDNACGSSDFEELTKEDIENEYKFWINNQDYSETDARDNVYKVV